jgi:putative (di)nucleoside polyphosphate hydrolase
MKSPALYFRAGVGAAIVNCGGLVLALERADIRGAWQLPQGGLKASESPLQAVFREVQEETGILQSALELLDTYPEPLAYDLPPAAWSKKTGRGQVGYWFLLRFHGSDAAIHLERSAEPSAWQWLPFARLVACVVEFRKPVYRHLQERFKPHLAGHSLEA